MRATFLLSGLINLLLLTVPLRAQTPAPVTLQATTSAAAAPAKPAATPTGINSDEIHNMLQLLQEMQSANIETIKKQQAALATLDALQKAAEEIKIFSKRG